MKRTEYSSKITSVLLAILLVIGLSAISFPVAAATNTLGVSYVITVSSKGDGDVSGGGKFAKGEKVTLTSSPDKGYKFDGWYNSATSKKLSSTRTYIFNAKENIDIYGKFVKNLGSYDTGGGGTGGSGGTGAKSTTTKAAAKTTTAKAITYDSLKSTLDKQIKAATGSVVNISVKNPTSISSDNIQKIAQAGKTAGKSVVIYANTLNSTGKAVEGRLYVDTSKLTERTSDLKLGVHTDASQTSKVKGVFEKVFQNKVVVIKFDQKGNLGAKLKVAAKIDTSELNTNQALVFYSYDAKTGKHVQLSDTDYKLDSKGYIHFYTNLGDYIIISDMSLRK